MVKIENGRYLFYTCKVEYDITNSDGKDEHMVVYTDSPSMYSAMGADSGIRNLRVENFTPTEHEVLRLEEVSSITSEVTDTNIADINLFIEHAVVKPVMLNFKDLDKLKEKYANSTYTYYLGLAKQLLAGARYFVEVGGIDYKDYRIDTSRETRTTMYNILDDFELGAITSIDFKTLDGQYVTMDHKQFKDLAKHVAIHKHNCFKAEKIIADKLEKLTAEQLYHYKKEAQRDNSNPDLTEEEVSMEFLFDTHYQDLMEN